MESNVQTRTWFNLNFISSANYAFDGRVQEQFPLEFLTDLTQHKCHGQAPHAYDFVGGLFHILLLHRTSPFSVQALGWFTSASPLSYPKSAKLIGNVRRDKKSLFNFFYPSYLNLTDTFFFHSDRRLTSLREQSSRNKNVE